MKLSRLPALGAGLMYLCATGVALAHVTLETREAPSGSAYKAVLRIGHGCDGSPTTGVRVRIPEGVLAVKPMPKPGWSLSTTQGTYAKPYELYGKPVAAGVTEISWSGGDLPDGWYEEFVFQVRLPDLPAGSVLHFPVVQECHKGTHRWIEIPAAGRPADDYREPAPALTLTGKPAGR